MGAVVRNHARSVSAAGRAYDLPRTFRFFSATIIVTLLSACSLGGGGSGVVSAPPPTPVAAQVDVGPRPMDSFRALAPAEGLKFQPLFGAAVNSDVERFARLEREVQTLRNDLDTVVPSLVRMVAVEKDMKELIQQLQTLTEPPRSQQQYTPPPPAPAAPAALYTHPIPGEDRTGGTDAARAAETARSAPPTRSSPVTPEAAPKGHLPPEGAASPYSPAPAAPRPAPAAPVAAPAPTAAPAPQQQQQASATTNERPGIVSVRVGDHADKTRIVVEVTVNTRSVASLVDNGKTLIVDIPESDWSQINTYIADSGKLVSAYSVKNGKLHVDLLYPSKITTREMLAPNGAPHYRLMIDLHSSYVHQG
ncbi:MAG: hypothetical protein OXT65_01115 [Alphaproteobacteria bacterium]|nr:hypothetical protein [Alphaproteobacteria bacterium]